MEPDDQYTLTDILGKLWQYPDFRAPQRDIIEAVIAGRDVLAILPTGAGKSLCFQLPALVLPGTTVVITPLVALMEDQVRELRSRQMAAAAYHSGLTAVFIRMYQDNQSE